MKYIKSIYIGLVGLLMTACQTEQWEASQGSLCITLAEDVSISTKSTPAELGKPTEERFTLNIVKESTGENTYNGIYKQTIPASTGAYTVTATYGTNLAIALDSPYYKGEETGVEVEVNQSTPVTLTCKVANALASVIYGEGQIDKFDELFSTYGVEVKVGNSSVTIGRNGSTTQSAYYRAGSTPTFTFKGTLKENSQNVSMEITSDELTTDAFQAGQHCKFTLSLKPATAGAIITVEKVEVETVTILETIPVEWLPKPKIEAEGFEANKLTFTETEATAASIKLITAAALQDLKLKFNFEDEQFQSSLQKDKEYVLSNVEDKQAIETALDITLPAIGTTGEVTLDLSPLLAKLQTNAGVTTNNSIEIDAKANNRWSSEKEENNVSRVFTLECNKPEFTVSVYPGNIWTKEFTMNALMEEQVTKGNFSKLSTDMKYQFSTNGESDWTDLGKDLRKADLVPGTTYYIRGVYRGEVCSNPVAVSTYPVIELENGDMEDWDYEITDDARNPITEKLDKIYWKKWFPWSSVSTSSIWNTVNQTTTQDGNIPGTLPWVGTPTPPYVGCCYVANSGTIPVQGEEAHSGKSALLKTVGWGSGSTAGGDASEIKHVTPAELYLGTYDLTNHQPIYGVDYASRPTAMKFWYKYIPKSTDLLIAQIVILDGEDTIIGKANIPSEEAGTTDWTERILPIEYTEITKAPKKMYIVFKSGSLTNTDIMDKPAFGNLSDAESVGSKLYIDDISLIYDK